MSTSPEHAADIQQLKRALGAIQKLRARVNELESAAREPIAIVGIGCRLPGGADTPAKLWCLLEHGIDAVGEVPSDRWDADAFYDPRPGSAGKLPTRRGAFIKDVDQFDPQFFGIAPREARAMDPQQRLILETAWEALEDAGMVPDHLAGSQTGVFIGIGLYDYSKLQAPDQMRDPALVDVYSLSGTVLCIAANRLSYALDLRGPSLAVDTACSSSLVAVHQAVQSLRRGESRMALAGGINLMLAPETGLALSRLLSPDGKCKFGDAGADGFVRGEGVVIVALKLLSQAVADGDPIYAVIRGSAVNQDGFTSGLSVPNGAAQQAVLRAALADAGIAPEQIDYVEAHGTGTALGDPIEIQALDAVLGQGREPDRPLLVGSVKTNFGHLEAGAGIIGLAKAALALNYGKIPPSLHYQRPNPNIPFERMHVRVQTELTDWPEGDRLAGVSSFGFGGTNSHVILQAAPPTLPAPEMEATPGHLLLISAKSEPAVRDLAARYAAYIAENPTVPLADICHAAATARTHHSDRLAVVAATADDLRAGLEAIAAGGRFPGASLGQVEPDLHPKVAFLFTGQGSQYSGMGSDLYGREPVFKAALDRCAGLFDPHLDVPLLDVIFAEPDTPAAQLLDQTAYTQPALFALEYALAELWMSWGVRPSAVAGHSLGEYTAACVAGVLTLEDAARLVAERGRLMGSLPEGGAMAAIFAAEEEVRSAIAPFGTALSVAAVNGPEHTVISGEADGVSAASEVLSERGFRVRQLTVSHAFHSALMDPILDEFEALASTVSFHAPRIPLISNLTGEAWGLGEIPDATYWRRHLREPVRFADSFQTLHDLGCQVFVEAGPAPALSGMGRVALPESAVFAPSLRSSDALQILKSLGILYTSGAAVEWRAVMGDRPRRHLNLPTYPWQHERYWFQQSTAGPMNQAAAPNRLHPLIDRELRSPALRDHVFETHLDRAALPYLDGHRVYGTMVLPAAAFLEMAIAAGQALEGRRLAVEEMTFDGALAIPETGGCTIQTILRRDGENLGFEITGQEEDGTWRRYATGRLAPARPVTPESTLAQARAACLDELTGEAVYARYTALGMQYGPAFQGITRLWWGPSASLAEVVLPAAAGDARGYLLHPALLDACLQVAGSLLPDEEDATYLPINLEDVTVQADAGNRVWCHVRSLPAGDSASLVTTIDIFGDEGQIIASVGRLTLRRAPRSALAAALNRHESAPLYEIVWREAPRAPSGSPLSTGRWLIFADPDGIAEELARTLQAGGNQVDLVFTGEEFGQDEPGRWRLNPAERGQFSRLLEETNDGTSLQGVVYLWGAGSSQGLELGLQGALHLAQALAEQEPTPLWLVTRGSQPAEAGVTGPGDAPLWGFARTLAREHPALRPVCIDLEPGFASDQAAEIFEEIRTGDHEDAVALRGGRRLVARLVQTRPGEPEAPVRLEVATRGSITGLELRPLTRQQLGPGQVEIQVHATGLSFRDILNVLDLYPGPAGHPGSDCAGIVTALGEGVAGFQIGDRVVALTEGCFSTYALAEASLTAHLPRGLSFAEGATVPGTFLTAAYALRHLAGIGPGMRVLIHAASGGVGQAAVQIAQAAGAEVFATAGNDEKRAFLRSLGIEHVYDSRSRGFAAAIHEATGGQGVDIVLNSLTGDLIVESFNALRDGGCFLEIGKRGIWSDEQVAALGRSIDYRVIYMGDIYENQPELARDLLRGLCEEVEEGTLTPLPAQTFPMGRYEDAFRLMSQTRHIGKVVVTQDHRSPFNAASLVRDDASYLITGGTGGLGLTVARWLAGHGARYIALAGRREPGEHARAIITELEEAGVWVGAFQADISCRDDVARLLSTIDDELPPLAGIVHAAGALDDGILLQQTWSRFERVLAAKERGAWNLHELTEALPLDFFVMFSSGAVLVGSPSQSNYAAANAALDALAHLRRNRGLPALSINWGPWGEIGMAAGLGDDHRRLLAGQGFQSLSTDEALRALESALAIGTSQVAVIPADWDRFAQVFAPSPPPSLFRDLVSAPASDAASGDLNGTSVADRLAATPPSLRRAAVLRYVREQGAQILGLAGADALPANRPLSELGLDSLMAVEMRNVLGRALGLSLPTTLLFDYPTSDALAGYLLDQLPGAEEPEADAAPDGPVLLNGEQLDLAALSDEEAEALLLAELGDD